MCRHGWSTVLPLKLFSFDSQRLEILLAGSCFLKKKILVTEREPQAKIQDLTRKYSGSKWKHHACSPRMFLCSTGPSPVLPEGPAASPLGCHSPLLKMHRCSHVMLKTVLSYYNVILGCCPVTMAPFTTAPCLLSSFSLEFRCSGWKVAESWRQRWCRWWHVVAPFCHCINTFGAKPMTSSRCFAQCTKTQFPRKRSFSHRISLEIFFILRQIRKNRITYIIYNH